MYNFLKTLPRSLKTNKLRSIIYIIKDNSGVLTESILCYDGLVSLQRLRLPELVDGGHPEVVLLALLQAVHVEEERPLVPCALALLDPLLGLGAEHLDGILLDRLAAIVQRGLPPQFAALGGDVGDLEGPLWPGGPAQHHQLHPLLVVAVAVLGPDLVLAVVTPDRVLDLPNRVVVRVGDLDPGVLLRNQRSLLTLEDEAVALGPGFVGHWLTNYVHRPAVGSSDLGKKMLNVSR